MHNMVSHVDMWCILHSITPCVDMLISMRNIVSHVDLWIYIVQCGFICTHMAHIAQYNSIC